MRAHKYVIKLNEKRKRILYGISTNVTFSPLITNDAYLQNSIGCWSSKSLQRSRSGRSSSRERKRFGEIENRDSRGSVGQGCSESLRVIRLFSVSLLGRSDDDRENDRDGERSKKESWRRRSRGMRGRGEETGRIYSAAVTLLRIVLPRCATVIAQARVS